MITTKKIFFASVEFFVSFSKEKIFIYWSNPSTLKGMHPSFGGKKRKNQLSLNRGKTLIHHGGRKRAGKENILFLLIINTLILKELYFLYIQLFYCKKRNNKCSHLKSKLLKYCTKFLTRNIPNPSTIREFLWIGILFDLLVQFIAYLIKIF